MFPRLQPSPQIPFLREDPDCVTLGPFRKNAVPNQALLKDKQAR